MMIIFLLILLLHVIIKNNFLKMEQISLNNVLNGLYQEKKNYNKEIEILKWNQTLEKLSNDQNIVTKYRPNKKLKVLVADYYKASANITNKVLTSIGIDAEFVISGEDVIDKVKNNNYDVIITNNILKGHLDGSLMLKYLKCIDGFQTPVIVLTTSKNYKNYFIAECGFDDYIEKLLDEKKAIRSLTKVIPNLVFTKVNK